MCALNMIMKLLAFYTRNCKPTIVYNYIILAMYNYL